MDHTNTVSRKKSLAWSVCIVAMFLALFILPAQAQEKLKETHQKRIQRPVVALDAATLQTEGMQIHLWGIKPAESLETSLHLKALDVMDEMIGQEQVDCRIMVWDIVEPSARCTIHTNEDLGLVMLQRGFAVIDRHQTYNTVFASNYEEAQNYARKNKKGVWRAFAKSEQKNYIPLWLEPYMSTVVPVSIIIGPFFALLLIGLFIRQGLQNVVKAQEKEFKHAREKEAALQLREKMVLISTLESEMLEDKSKIEAFLTIYRELLENLKNPEHMPNYQQAGELVPLYPSLSRGVFDANVERFSVLDLKLASDISKLYSFIHEESDYMTLEPSTSREDAVQTVQKVLYDAEALLPQMDYILGQLQSMVQRNL